MRLLSFSPFLLSEQRREMKKKIFVFLFGLVLFSGAGILVASYSGSTVSGQTSTAPDQPSANARIFRTNQSETPVHIPDNAFFDMLFNEVLSMERAAADLEAKGKNGEIWGGYFERQAGLTKSQIRELRKVTREFEREIIPVQRRALQIVTERRAQRARGEELSVSEELILLQDKRNGTALRYGNRLQKRLGTPAIDKLREVLQQGTSASDQIVDTDRIRMIERIRQLRTGEKQTFVRHKRED